MNMKTFSKNEVAEQILGFIGLDSSFLTRKKESSSYIRLYSTTGKWVSVRISDHSENESRRIICDHYISIVNDANGLNVFIEFCKKNNLKFQYEVSLIY